MISLSWFKLFVLEQKLNFGAFGKYNRYRCRCLEQNAKTAAEKLRIAQEVLSGPGVSLAESLHNVEYLRKMKAHRQADAVQADEWAASAGEEQSLETKSPK